MSPKPQPICHLFKLRRYPLTRRRISIRVDDISQQMLKLPDLCVILLRALLAFEDGGGFALVDAFFG
ncbi:hypothetical protein D3C76_1752990 [compost metagenome]